MRQREGRPRNPDTWDLLRVDLNDPARALALQPTAFFDRGYTGHEHMAGFGLINMNGRVYDPYLQRFLSPDPYVQAPHNAQNYNRYAYCLNNPLMYTDPSGEVWHIIIPSLIRGVINLAINWKSIDNFWEGAAVFLAGAANGAMTTISPMFGAAFGEAIERGVNRMVALTGNGVGLGDVNWRSVGKEALYGFGGGLATGLVSQNFKFEIKYKGFTVWGGNRMNLTAASHRFASIQNHVVRSAAYHIGGNILTGNSPLKGFKSKNFWGLNSSILLPATIDGLRYVGEQRGWANNFLEKNSKDQFDQQFRELGGYDSPYISHNVLGVDFSSVNISPDGRLFVWGKVAFDLLANIPGDFSSEKLHLVVSKSTDFNIRALYTLFFK